ncbi:MAG: cytochrome c oxidase subunit 3, partial [Betaproteobacteria bacterium]
MAAVEHNPDRYFVPQPANYPIRGSLALLLLATGAVLWMNHVEPGPWVVLAGFAVLVWMLFGWFGKVISESESRVYNKQVDAGFRWS